MYIIKGTYSFIWDNQKNRQNIVKHGIDFEDAKELFFRPFAWQYDQRINYGEERMIAYGYLHDQPIAIVYTQPEPNLYRLISARLATMNEERELLFYLGLEYEKKD